MECPNNNGNDDSVYSLITKLCENIASSSSSGGGRTVKRMRSRAYEILLKKSTTAVVTEVKDREDPLVGLLTYYFAKSACAETACDYHDSKDIKERADWIVASKVGQRIEYFNDVLECIVALQDSVKGDHGRHTFENPFTFGKLDRLLETNQNVAQDAPKPYQHLPWQMFEMPFNITDFNSTRKHDSTPYPYLLQNFTAKPGTKLSHLNVIGSNTNSPIHESQPPSSVYSNIVDELISYPRLMAPRDLKIPIETKTSNNCENSNTVNINSPLPIEESPSTNVWDLARIDSDKGSTNVWEEVSKMPDLKKRNFISSSTRQMHHWKLTRTNKSERFNVISESQFILHLKYLTIGIESNSFFLDKLCGKFAMKPDLCVEGLLQVTLRTYVAEFIKIGTCYWKLYNLTSTSEMNKEENGFIFQISCDNIRHFLIWFRLEIDKLFGEGLVVLGNNNNCLPTLIEIVKNVKPLSVQIQTMLAVFKNCEAERSMKSSGLMACLYNEVVAVTDFNISPVLYAMLKRICTVYFGFIQKFIFEGELDDIFNEFFIKKDIQHSESYNKRYWNKGFIFKNEDAIPEFLYGMAKYILLCGKSLRLLKLCNPSDPLCIMLSTDYPPMKCCFNFDEINSQRLLYNQYRTQCLYVCGEPVTFSNIMMQKEAERRAIQEVLVHKQAENMEKLIEERKRLSRMLQAKKRQQFNALREAAENAITMRKQEKERILKEEKLLLEYSKTCDKRRELEIEDQKRKVLAFYKEIEEEVEKRHMLADWKIKRLKLDQNRMQLITSEKIKLNREKFENEHKNDDGDIMLSSLVSSRDEILANKVKSKLDSADSIVVRKRCDINSISLNANSLDVFDINTNIVTDEIDMVSVENETNNNEKVGFQKDENVSREHQDLTLSDIRNSNTVLNTYEDQKREAIKNKQKVMSQKFAMDNMNTQDWVTNNNVQPLQSHEMLSMVNNNTLDAQKNRSKVLGSDFNKPYERPDVNFNNIPQYNTEASREALKNKQKVLGHEYGMEMLPPPVNNFLQHPKRVGLTLDLNKCKNRIRLDWKNDNKTEFRNGFSDFTPGSCANTPGDLPLRLDIETPSTFDIGPFGLPSTDTASPTSAQIAENTKERNAFIADKGFNFPNLVEEYVSDDEYETDDAPKIDTPDSKYPVWNFIEDELNFDRFEPFGIARTANEKISTMDIFDRTFSLKNDKSPYTDIDEIIQVAIKRPMCDLFKMINFHDERDDSGCLERIEQVDPSTIATCLQRSVVIPLRCQMELVNNAILKYFLVDCDLYDHMKNVRDYFFLMDGEFAKMFCVNLFDKLNSTENPRELLNYATLHGFLDKSCVSSLGGASKHTENLSFVLGELPVSFCHSSPDVLECLTLSYSVGWPLNIIFSQEAMDRYAKIFKFLVKIRRISWVLEHDSEVLKKSMKDEFMVARELLFSPQYHSVQLYRYIMSSLIQALNCYIMTTCLQTSWSEFEKDLMNARTLDDLYSIHVIYIKKVLFRCLLNKRSEPLMKILNDIFTVVLKFHHSLNARCWHIAGNEIHYTHPLFAQLRELFISFEKLSRHLHKMVTRLTDCGYQPHLAELLSVINMNGYYKGPLKK